MPDPVDVLALEGKREAVAQAYALWVQNVTGSRPSIQRSKNGRVLRLSDAQKEAMKEDIYASIKAKAKPTDLNVSMPWNSFLTPALLKAYWPMLAGGAAFLAFTGYLLGSKGKSRR